MVLLDMTSQKEKRAAPSMEFLDRYIAETACGSTEGLSDLYKVTASAVYSYAFSILKNQFDAEDTMHECYLRIHEAAPQYRSQGKPMAWILTITRNLCLQKLRQREKVSQLSDEDWSCIPEDNRMLSTEDRLVLQKCMQILTDEERQIIVLHAVAGLKHREIAAHMGLLLPTVLSKYNRGIKKLKYELEREEHKE